LPTIQGTSVPSPYALVGDKVAQERFGEDGVLSDLKHEVESTMKYHWCAKREQRIAEVICQRCKHYSTKDQKCSYRQKGRLGRKA
ncbi:MAG: hypothetical protein QXT73_06930, partial [Candidatus Methanomethylicaceae archaeon]